MKCQVVKYVNDNLIPKYSFWQLLTCKVTHMHAIDMLSLHYNTRCVLNKWCIPANVFPPLLFTLCAMSTAATMTDPTTRTTTIATITPVIATDTFTVPCVSTMSSTSDEAATVTEVLGAIRTPDVIDETEVLVISGTACIYQEHSCK